MTDIPATDTSLARAKLVRPGRRANQILAIALAVTVTVAAGFVAAGIAGDGESATVDRAVDAVQLRWEGLASAQAIVPAAQLASQLRWEGLGEGFASATNRSITAQVERWNAVAADHASR